MEISVFDLFRLGIGPSSSHTVGPMRAANFLVDKLKKHKLFDSTARISVELFASLASTGRGHNTDKAIVWGLLGEKPDTIDPLNEELYNAVASIGRLSLHGEREIPFDPASDIIFRPNDRLPHHPNAMRFHVFDARNVEIYTKVFYSLGGGFIVGSKTAKEDHLVKHPVAVPYPFASAAELLEMSRKSSLTIGGLVYENEKSWRSEEEIETAAKRIFETMDRCIALGLKRGGVLPGRLKIRRRAPEIFEQLRKQDEGAFTDPLAILDWVVLYALAVNEENASGGRIVTAPTNGAAGIVPAVLRYYIRFTRPVTKKMMREFLFTAGAVGLLYKTNASISGAEVGCQGEVGVACSMAAAGLTAAMGGTMNQVENAAEIGMEHNLGLTCDPVDGLVQIPCIERNAMAAVKAISASRMALRGDGRHYVSLDEVIATMRQTGRDMRSTYKETSKAGLATHITEC